MKSTENIKLPGECITETYNLYFPELIKSMKKYAYIIKVYNWKVLWTDPEFLDEQRILLENILYDVMCRHNGFYYPKSKIKSDVSWLMSRKVVLMVYLKCYNLIRSDVKFTDAQCIVHL